MSPRFCGLIKKLNKNLECFESVIKYAGKEKDLKDNILYDDFYTLVFPEYELFNWDASEYVSDISFDGSTGSFTALSRGIILGDKPSCRDCRACKVLHGSI